MGSENDEEGRLPDEGPVHQVRITRSFYMAATEVTQRQFDMIMRVHPWKDPTPDVAAGNINQLQAIDFCNLLTRLEQSAGKLPRDAQYRLPTEAEWEYACRAGTNTPYAIPGDAKLSDYAWYHLNQFVGGGDKARRVAQKRPNPWGLYDMHGNMWEWCTDRYRRDYYALGDAIDPQGPAEGNKVLMRGGCWRNPADDLRSAKRSAAEADGRYMSFGFRVVRTLSAKESK